MIFKTYNKIYLINIKILIKIKFTIYLVADIMLNINKNQKIINYIMNINNILKMNYYYVYYIL